MEIMEVQNAVDVDLKISLIDGEFSVKDAKEILFSMLDKKINFHVLQRLMKTEGDHNDSCAGDSNRINALRQSRANVEDLLNEISNSGYQLEINSTIDINVIKK